MKPLTSEWISKAEGDYQSAQRELRARKNPNYDDACFHVQQCVEKYLKARLQEASIPIERIHNLLELLDTVKTIEPSWEVFRPNLQELNAYAVRVRYPGASADKGTARLVVAMCREIREIIRLSLGLQP